MESCKPFISWGFWPQVAFLYPPIQWHTPRHPATRRSTDDDRTGLRVLYPDPADTLHQGSISGRIIPANPLALPAFPPGVTVVFGAQVVAVDNSTGGVIAATLGGWSCTAPGPVQFDGYYQIAGLSVGSSFTV